MRQPIDGYDWDIQDEPVERYPREFVQGALQRAFDWKLSQNPNYYQLLKLRQQPFNQPKELGYGWVQIGYLRSDSWRLKVYWCPEDDRVQLEREAGPEIILPPSSPPPKPQSPKPWRFQVIVKYSFMTPDIEARVRVKAWPSVEHRDHQAPDMVFRLPPPPDRNYYLWTSVLQKADFKLVLIEMGDEIKMVSGPERRRLLTEEIWRLMDRPDDRWRLGT